MTMDSTVSVAVILAVFGGFVGAIWWAATINTKVDTILGLLAKTNEAYAALDARVRALENKGN